MLGPWAPQNLWLGKQTLLLGGMLYFILFYNNAWSEKHYVSPVKLKQYQFENKILTGVSGSSENRFNLSSLLAERIPSSVSEIYCYGRNGKKDGKRQSKDNFIQIINCLIRFLLFQWVLLSNGLDLKGSYMYVYVMSFFSKWIVCVLEAYQNITNASSPNIRKVNFLEYLETSTDYQSYSFLSSAKAFLCFLAVFMLPSPTVYQPKCGTIGMNVYLVMSILECVHVQPHAKHWSTVQFTVKNSQGDL